MLKIGVLSDTHGWLNPKVLEFFKECDEIWHAGDIGGIDLADELANFKPLRAVYGNTDDWEVRREYPMIQIFNAEDLKVIMTHIGGYPSHYEPEIKGLIVKERPNIFISGHSHILKIMQDKKYNLLHINPGAAGRNGFHKTITMVRFQIDGKRIEKMEVFEQDRNTVGF